MEVFFFTAEDPFGYSDSTYMRIHLTNQEKLDLVHGGLPLNKVGPHSYAFLHKSLLEYFAGEQMCHQFSAPDIKEKSEEEGFDVTKRLLNDEPETIKFLAERVRQEIQLEYKPLTDGLFEWIERSKSDPMLSIACANSLTILVAADISLSLGSMRMGWNTLKLTMRNRNAFEVQFYVVPKWIKIDATQILETIQKYPKNIPGHPMTSFCVE